MILYVLRHAQAEDKAEQGGDEARRLTARGRDKMRSAAAGLRAMSLKFDAIVTSPYSRAAETAEIVAAVYANDPPPQVLPALASGIPPAEAVAALAPFARYEHLMIVGHEPQLSGVVSLLLSGSSEVIHLRFKKGGCVALELSNRFERGGAELLWMLSQSQLRKFRK
jgi:phosphohistidine phosphatase